MTGPALPSVDPSGAGQQRFEAIVRAAGMDPHDRWTGGYAAYEWEHLRPALQAYAIAIEGRAVLEFGCNVGGSAVVLAALGATVSGVDADPAMPPIAAANLARHGLPGEMRLAEAGRPLPFADASFDLILANSVLEYVDPALLDRLFAEFHRLLRPEGRLFVCGTASRLPLRERHSGRWLVNWLPQGFDRLIGRSFQRGLGPMALAAALKGRFAEAGEGTSWLAARRAIHGTIGTPVKAVALLGRLTGRHPGWFAPYIELLLRRV